MPNNAMNSDQGIAIGQVWRHHSVGDFTVVDMRPGGRIAIRQGANPSWVWHDYLRDNFTLVATASDQKENS